MQTKDRGWVVLSLFFCSGATALVYEVIWSKFLAQMFGSTIYAQTVVLAVFMGGLALGNRLLGKWADRLKNPVGAYGYLEIVIGLYAFFFPTLDKIADQIFVRVGGVIIEHAGWLLALKAVLAAGLLLLPTVLMGGTLPLLAAWLQKNSPDAGRRSARFYSVNSLGAVTGSAIAGFWLVQNLGMIAGLQLTALVNVLVGGIAIVIARNSSVETQQTESPVAAPTEIAPAASTLRWAGATVATTGFVSMGLEVLAARSLSLIFGSSLQSFAIVLMAFILGIGLGAAWIASPRRRNLASERMVVLLLCVAAVWVTLLVFNIEKWVDFYRIAKTGLGRTPMGYTYHQFLAGGISLVVLGLPAACIGAVLPLMIRAVSTEGAPLGAKVGALLTWNTLGAVAGVLVTGFVIMPVFGLRNAFAVLALGLAAAGLWTAWRSGLRLGAAGATACGALACCLFLFGGEGWRHVLSSGVFRARETKFDASAMAVRKANIKILLYEDAPDATVTVEQGRGTGLDADRALRINGKADASSKSDQSTQLLLAHLPMLIRPQAKDVFVLGLGSGITAGGLLPYPVQNITVAENCAPVIRAARFFEDWNRRVLDEPRVRVWREDARTILKLRPQQYDVIITEPSNPWTAGVGSVFSKEYYELAASRLKPGGIMAQWFHVYEMHDGIVALVLQTFSSVFPYVEIWDTSGGDIVMIGSQEPWASGPENFRRGFELPGVKSDLASIGIHSPEALLLRQIASQRIGSVIAKQGPVQSDLFPVLEYAAPEAFFIGERAKLIENYDERTKMAALAPASKRAVLREIPKEHAQAVFAKFKSVNPELAVALASGTNAPAHPVGAAMDAGNLQQAMELAQQALKKHPNDGHLNFVRRVVEQEWKLRQAAGTRTAQR